MRTSVIVIAGGCDERERDTTSVEIIGQQDKYFKDIPIPELPYHIKGYSLVMHDSQILLCGGVLEIFHFSRKSRQCLTLIDGRWSKHSTLNMVRFQASIVSTNVATFAFGGTKNPFSFIPNDNYNDTYEYLPKNSATWKMGKTQIPTGFYCGFAINNNEDREIWLVGGKGTENRILSFDVQNHTFREMSFKLNVGRYVHKCAFIPGTNKIMVTGGRNNQNFFNSTEIIDIESETVTMANPMNTIRFAHGIGNMTINNEERLVVFGGPQSGNSVEVYNPHSQTWQNTNIELKNSTYAFGFLSTKLINVQMFQ